MKVHAWNHLPLLWALAILISGWGDGLRSSLQAQSPGHLSANRESGGRESGGWQATAARSEPKVQTAYYQASGNLSDSMPAFPSGGSPATGGYDGVTAAGGVVGPVTPPAQTAPNFPMPNMRMPGGGAASTNSYPPALPPGPAAQLASGELRSPQAERLPTGPNAAGTNSQFSTSAPRSPTSLSSGAIATPAGSRIDPQLITTGYPYVTPPPRSRYATAPYQPAIFQTTYQLPSSTAGVAAQLTSASQAPTATANLAALQTAPPANVSGNPNLSAVPYSPQLPYSPQPQSGLPQFQAIQPGVYPTAYQCTTPAPSFPSTGAVPGAYIPPTLPPNMTPGLYTPNNSGYVPLFSLGQENYNVQLGRGIIGQPTVYVPGQPIRNFMRYLSP